MELQSENVGSGMEAKLQLNFNFGSQQKNIVEEIHETLSKLELSRVA